MIRDKLAADLKKAMRARDSVRLRTIRSINAAIKEKEIEKRTQDVSDLTDEDVLAVLQRQAKQRRDSIEQFEKGGRQDLAKAEGEELAVIEEYLPEQLGDEAIQEKAREVIRQVGATGPGDLGKVMGRLMSDLRGKADGKRVQSVVRELLTG